MGCVFYRVEDWDVLQIDLHVSPHDGFKIQFADIVPVFLEFNVQEWPIKKKDARNATCKDY